MDVICIDFETEAIEARPKYPPKPVGLAVKWPGKAPKYLAWGHPYDNNCKQPAAKQELEKIWASGLPVLMHNAKFDLEVAYTHFGMDPLPPARVHDTMFLLFLNDPHSNTLSLKPSAERLLDMPPDERDLVKEWLVQHGVITTTQNPGPFICMAPGNVVAVYAIGDVLRTVGLFELLLPLITSRGMLEAYRREQALLPILMDNERHGIRVSPSLEAEVRVYEASLQMAEAWLRKKLKKPYLNLDANVDLADALFDAGFVKEFAKTPTGKRSTAKGNLKIVDPDVALALDYRNRLQNVLAQSMRPWLEQAKVTGGYIFTDWNQVRAIRGSGTDAGTRTGRLSCGRFMNIAKEFKIPAPTFISGALALPLVRKYLLPDPGHVWVHRDYNQQEFRILAHFEDDRLLAAYKANPRIDYHDNMKALIEKITGKVLERRAVKILNFGINYGMGAGKLAAGLGVTVEEARNLRLAQQRAVPGVRDLDAELKRRGRAGEPVRTWGGRLYFCEPPVDGRSFEYKLLNYLIQGSAADCTKEAIIRLHDVGFPGRMLVTVHDEINLSSPDPAMSSEILRVVMEGIEFDVPMLTDAKTGPNWGEIR